MQKPSENNFFLKRCRLLTVIVFVLQPVLDVMSYWFTELGISGAITSGLRLVLLFAVFIFGYSLSKKRKAYWFLAGVLLILAGGHIISCSVAGYQNPVEDLSEVLRVFSMPLTALPAASIAASGEEGRKGIRIGLTADLGLIIVIEILATLTGTDPHTYANKGIGVLGWFNWTNTESAILSILVCLVIGLVLSRFSDRLWLLALAGLSGFLLLYLNATRLAYFSIFAIAFCMAAALIINDGWGNLKKALVLVFCAAIFLALYGESPMLENRVKLGSNELAKQEEMIEIVEEAGYDASSLRCEDTAVLEKVYAKYLQAHIDRFGIERTAKAMDYSISVYEVGNARVAKSVFCKLAMEEHGILSRIFGMELADMRQYTNVYDYDSGSWHYETKALDEEYDLRGVYRLLGIAGAAVWIVMIFGAGALLCIRILKSLKKPGSEMLISTGIAWCIAAVFAVGTNSLLRHVDGCFYMGLVVGLALYFAFGEAKEGKEN